MAPQIEFATYNNITMNLPLHSFIIQILAGGGIRTHEPLRDARYPSQFKTSELRA